MDDLNKHQLNSLINLLQIAIPYVNKETEFIRLQQWIGHLSSKLNQSDTYNYIFDQVSTQFGEQINLSQSQYLKYRGNLNIYHKRIISYWDQGQPRPLSQYVFKNYNWSNKSKFQNLISGRGVPMTYNYWLTAKDTIFKSIKNKQTHLPNTEESYPIYRYADRVIDNDLENVEMFKKKEVTLNKTNFFYKEKIRRTFMPNQDIANIKKHLNLEENSNLMQKTDRTERSERTEKSDRSSNQDINENDIKNFENLDIEVESQKSITKKYSEITYKENEINNNEKDMMNQIEINNNNINHLDIIDYPKIFQNFTSMGDEHYLDSATKNIQSEQYKNENRQKLNIEDQSGQKLIQHNESEKTLSENGGMILLEKGQSNNVDTLKQNEKYKEYNEFDLPFIADVNTVPNSGHDEIDEKTIHETEQSIENLKMKKKFKFDDIV